MAYKQKSPVPIVEGGTTKQSFTAYAVVCGGTTSTSSLQSVSGLGTSGQTLTSTGLTSLPTWQDAPTEQTNVVFNPVATDPVSPSVSDVWFNTTSNSFKGYNGAVKTFSVS